MLCRGQSRTQDCRVCLDLWQQPPTSYLSTSDSISIIPALKILELKRYNEVFSNRYPAKSRREGEGARSVAPFYAGLYVLRCLPSAQTDVVCRGVRALSERVRWLQAEAQSSAPDIYCLSQSLYSYAAGSRAGKSRTKQDVD